MRKSDKSIRSPYGPGVGPGRQDRHQGEPPHPFGCPDCACVFETLEALGVHLQRHAPQQPPRYSALYCGRGGRLLSCRCPRGCGRFFRSCGEMRAHARICDGSEPLSPPARGVDIIGNAGKTAGKYWRKPKPRPRLRAVPPLPEEVRSVFA